MDINAVILIVEAHADKIAEKYVKRLRKEEGMEAYALKSDRDLVDHVKRAYEEIGICLDDPCHPVLKDHFRQTGRRRGKEGVPLVQVVRAVQIARIVLWQYVLEQGLFDSTANLYQGLNLYRQVVNFFDRAVLYTIEGYLE